MQRNEMKAHAQEKVGCGNRAWPIRGMYGIINRGGRNFSITKTDIIHKFTIVTLLISTKKSPGGYINSWSLLWQNWLGWC